MPRDYLALLASSHNVAEMATLVRAFACRVMGTLTCYSDAEIARELRAYESKALVVERFPTAAGAREYLRTEGFFGRTFRKGDRVVLTRDAERFPHFHAPKGSFGTVAEATAHILAVTLDEKVEGAEEWDNAVCWSSDEDEFYRPPLVELSDVTLYTSVPGGGQS